jgi:hypothetical protein
MDLSCKYSVTTSIHKKFNLYNFALFLKSNITKFLQISYLFFNLLDLVSVIIKFAL